MQHLIRFTTLLTLAFGLALAAPSTAQQPGGEIRPGKWNTKAEIPDGWVVFNSRHYQIQSQVGKDKAKRLSKHMEKMFRVYTKLFPPGKSGFTQKPVKLFKDRQSFVDYGNTPGAAGYYTYDYREMVCYDTGKWMDEDDSGPTTGGKRSRREIMEDMLQRSKMDLLGVMAHEGWHQYFHWYVVSLVQLPSWINEGMGDYFYAARPIEGSKRRVPVTLGRMNNERLPIIKAAVRQGRNVPLKKFIYYMQREYYSNPGICYAQGWAFCQFLLHHDDKRVKAVIPYYIRLVKDDTNTQTVTEKAFRGIDLDELDKEFTEWVMTLKSEQEEEIEKMLEGLEEGEGSEQPENAANDPGRNGGQ